MAKTVAKPRLVKGAAIIAKAVTTKTAPVLRARRDRHQTQLYQAPEMTPLKKTLPKKPVAKKLKKVVLEKRDKNNNKVIKKGKGGKVEKGKKTVVKKAKKGNDRLKRRDGIQVDEGNPFFNSTATPTFVSGSTYHRWLIRALVRNSSSELKAVMKSNRAFSYADERTADGVASLIKDSKLAEEYQKLKETRDEKKTIQAEPNLLQRRSTGQRNFYMLGRATRNIEMSRGGREGNNAFLNYEEGRGHEETGLTKLVEENTEYKELLRRSQMKSQPFSMSSLESELVTAVRHGHCELGHAIASAEAQYCTNELHRLSLKIGGKLPQKILSVSVVKKAFNNRNITPFHTAAINPDGAKMLEQLRSADPNINIPDQDNWYTIHYAAVNRDPRSLQFLLRNGATPTMLNKKQQSPLHVACIAGRVETTKVLLEAIQKMEKGEGSEGPKPDKSLINARAKDGNTALLLAVKYGRVEVIKALLDCETVLADAPSSTTTNKLTPLMVACSLGNLEVAKLLVEKGALVEGKDKKKRTALHHSVLNGQQHTAAFLLSMGTDLLKGDSSGNTPAHYAAAYGWLGCLQLLADVDPNCLSQENDWKLTPLTVAFLKGHYGVVSWLLDGKYKDHVDINGKDTEGYTLLSCLLAFSDPTAHHQLPEQIDYLLSRGADCSLTDSYDNTILHDFASLKVKLIGAGEKEKDGMTEKQYQACFDKLVRQAPESVKARNRNGDTPMHLAVQQGNLLAFNWMLARIDIRQFFKDKWTSTANIVHALLTLPATVWNNCTDKPSPAPSNYDILPILKKLQETCPTEFKEWLREKNAENQEPALAFVKSLFFISYHGMSDTNPKTFIKYLCDVAAWICDIEPETPSILTEKTDKTPTMSLVAECFQISLEEGSHQLLQTLLKKAVQHKVIEKVLHQEIDGLPLIFVSLCNTTITGILLRCARENNCQKGIHDAVWKWQGEGNKKKEINKSLLMYIIEEGAFDLVLELDMDQNGWMAKDTDGNSAWHYASKSNHHRTLALMKILENHKIPLEANSRGCTPLHVAVQSCDGEANSVLEPIEWLVTRSNVADQDTFGRTAIHYAFGSCSGENDLSNAPSQNDPIAVVSILAADANEQMLNVEDVHGNTVLHLAAAAGANICSVTLLRKGAKVDLKNKEGNTPLALAVRYGRQGVALTLIQANSNVTDKVFVEKKKEHKKVVEWIWNCLKEVEQPTPPSSIPAQIVKRGTDWAAMVYVLLDSLGKNTSSLAQIAACALREKQYNLANQLLKSLEAILDGQPLKSAEDLIVTFAESCQDVAISPPVNPQRRRRFLPSQLFVSNNSETNQNNSGLQAESVERTVLERLLAIGCPILQNGASPALEIALFNQAWSLADFLKDKMGPESWSQLKSVNVDEGPLKALLATGSHGGKEFSQWIDHILGLRHLNATTCAMTLPVPRDLKGIVDGKFTAVGWAALNGSVDLIYFLRTKGFDVNAADDQGRTPLMLALLANKEKAVEALVDEKTSKTVNIQLGNKEVVQIKMSLGNHLAFTLNGRKRKAPESDDEDDEDEDESENSEGDDDDEEEETEKEAVPLKKLKITNKNLNLELKDKHGRNILHYMAEPVAWENTDLLTILAKENKPLIKKLLLEKDRDGKTPTTLAAEKKQGAMAAAMSKISGQNVKVQSTPLPSVAHLKCPYDISSDSTAYIKKFAEEHDKKKSNEQEDDKPHKLSGYGETGHVVKCSQTNQYFKVLLNKSDMSYGRFGFHNFYRMELIKRRDTDLWNIFTNWGRIGSGDGEYQNTPFTSLDTAVKEFCSIFKSKTGQEWLPLENFVEIKKKYRLVKVDKSPASLAELKLPTLKKEDEKDEVRAFVRDISDPEKLKEYQRNVRNNLSIVSPFGRVTKEAIEKGRQVLIECEKVAKEIEKAMGDKNSDQDKLIQLLNTANDLSSEFYTVIPSGNAEYSSLQRFDNEAAINQALTQLNRMSEIEIAARILTAAAYREDVERVSYIQKAMECDVRAMTPDEPMSQYILQWIHNTKNEHHSIKGILEIAPRVSVTNFQKFSTEGNQKYLLHGTRAVNLLSLLRGGFLIDPQNTQINGRLFGDGIYLADCFGKSHNYCQDSSRGWKYMFVCQVSFGKLAIRNKDDYQEENLKNYDSLHMKGTCYPEYAITVDGVSMPLGTAKDRNSGYWRHNYSEYIVHDPMRVLPKYIIMYK